MSLSCVQEVEAYTYEGKPLHYPDPGHWLRLDCPSCGRVTETIADVWRDGVSVECDHCATRVRVLA